MTQRLERRLMTGWFCPRLPNGSLNVVAPAAMPSIWLPRQMPKMGLTGASPESCASITALMLSMVTCRRSRFGGEAETDARDIPARARPRAQVACIRGMHMTWMSRERRCAARVVRRRAYARPRNGERRNKHAWCVHEPLAGGVS
eukprot:6190663-Pleurochrysis_carterae.AAC.1